MPNSGVLLNNQYKYEQVVMLITVIMVYTSIQSMYQITYNHQHLFIV